MTGTSSYSESPSAWVAGRGTTPPATGLHAVGGHPLLVLSDALRWPSGVRRLSPFDHLAAAPVERVDAPSAAALQALTVLGVVGHRDLRGQQGCASDDAAIRFGLPGD